MANSLDSAQPWIMLDGDETTVITSKELMRLAVDARAAGDKGSFDELGGRKVFRLPSVRGEIPFLVFIQTRPNDDLEHPDIYSIMGGK